MKGFEILTREVPLFHPSLIYNWGPVKVKYWKVTWAWNGDLKQDQMVTTNIKNNGLNTDQNMVNSSKHKTTAFEIQARDKHTVAPSPPTPQLRGPHLWLYLFKVAQCTKNNKLMPFPASIVARKKGFFNWPWETLYYCTGTYNPETAIIFKSVGKVPTFHLFFNPFSPSTLKYMCVSCRSCDDTVEKVCLFQYHLIYMHIYPLFQDNSD